MPSLIRHCILVTWLFTAFAWADTPNTAPTFTLSDGKVTTSFGAGAQSIPYSVALQADGKILVAGSSGSGTLFALARYNANGILDSSFGTEGKVTTGFGYSVNSAAYRVTVQADGKILLAGAAFSSFALARYNTDGSLDTSFGSVGKVTTSFAGNGAAYGITLQSDGKILVAGSAGGTYFAVARYNTDGSLDTGFGSAGKVTTTVGSTGMGDYAYSVTVQPDGKILVAGDSNNQFALVRYNIDGSLDTSFDTDGKVTTSFDVFNGQQSAQGYSVALQADGNIVVAGSYFGNFALARYKPDGGLDSSFGSNGKVTVLPNSATGSSGATGPSGTGGAGNREPMKDLAIQADGKILVTGNHGSKLTLARFSANGSLDTSFDMDGMVTISDSGTVSGSSVAVQTDGRILATGQSSSDFTLLRFIENGRPDNTFAAPKNTLSARPSVFEPTSSYPSPLVLDANVQIYDAELSAANNYDGATLTLSRHNGASVDDVFAARGGTLTTLLADSYFAVENVTIGRVIKNDAGTLTLSFYASATQALVNKTMQQIAYANASNSPPTTVQIDWTFSDGNTGAQGTGGSLSVVGSTIVNIFATNDAPVVSVPLPDIFLKPNTTLNYVIPSDTFVDPDGNLLALSVLMTNGTGLPPWLTFAPATRTLSGTPSDADIGSISINIKATDNIASATDTVILTVNNKATQTVSFSTAPTIVMGGTGTVLASASSGLAVSFSSTTLSVCTVSGNIVTGVTAGNCKIAATQTGDANYNAALQVTQSIAIGSNNGTALNMLPSWNLMGNGVDASIDVATVFNDASKLSTVWKWVPATSRWAFYTPTLSDGGAAYAASKGYDFLTTINGGEGFWVNAKAAFTVLLPSQVAIQSSSFMPALASPVTPGGAGALPPGWSLIATGDNPTPSWFDGAIATGLVAPPMAGQVYGNVTTLWAWDAVKANWYFWAPSLFTTGTLANYIVSKSYLDFSTMPSLPAGTLSPTTGFWVNMP